MQVLTAKGGEKKCAGAGTLPLASIYELSGRPNANKVSDVSQAVWDAAICKALVERPKKHLDVMGHWIQHRSQGIVGAQVKVLALFPEEALLLVQQGLLLLRSAGSSRALSVAEAQGLVLHQPRQCPLFFEVYSRVRELGLVALRMELVKDLTSAVTGTGSQPIGIEPGDCHFRGRPILALWNTGRARQKGWRQSAPDFILATSRADDNLPSATEWAHIEAVAARTGASVKVAVVDDTGSPIFFDCSSEAVVAPGAAAQDAGGSPKPTPEDACAGVERLINIENVMEQIKLQGDKVRGCLRMSRCDVYAWMRLRALCIPLLSDYSCCSVLSLYCLAPSASSELRFLCVSLRHSICLFTLCKGARTQVQVRRKRGRRFAGLACCGNR
jgi:hypothetical protein